MARRVSRYWSKFLGGGSVVVGVGLTYYGFNYSSDRGILNNCRCEPQRDQYDEKMNFSKKQWEVKKLIL